MQMRFYYDAAEKDCLKQLCIKMANAEFYYGFEYLGITDKLVLTNWSRSESVQQWAADCRRRI